jgi:hypothetical protein
MKNIVLYMHPNFLSEFTYYRAFKNIAEENGFSYTAQRTPSSNEVFGDDLVSNNETVLVAMVFNPAVSSEQFAKIRAKFPNAKLMVFGGDMQYYGYKLQEGTDIFLDFTSSICRHIQAMNEKTNVYKIMWTHSEDVIEISDHLFIPGEYTKKYDFLCPFRICCDDRRRLIQPILNKGFSLEANVLGDSLNDKVNFGDKCLEVRMQEMIEYYFQSRFLLGTTLSIWDGGARTMKGLRDVMAPLCGTVLIADNYPDMMEIDCLPIYRNHQELFEIVEQLSSPETYSYILAKQQRWAETMSLEQQLTPILKTEGIL